MDMTKLPDDIVRARVVSTKDAAEFCGFDIQVWRRLAKEGAIPPALQLSERKRGWRLGDLVEFNNRRAGEAA